MEIQREKVERLVDAVKNLLAVTGWCSPEGLGLADELAFLEEAVEDVTRELSDFE